MEDAPKYILSPWDGCFLLFPFKIIQRLCHVYTWSISSKSDPKIIVAFVEVNGPE